MKQKVTPEQVLKGIFVLAALVLVIELVLHFVAGLSLGWVGLPIAWWFGAMMCYLALLVAQENRKDQSGGR